MYSKASGAGWTFGTEGTVVWQQEVRSDELVRGQKRLVEVGLVDRRDELASARRRFNHLTGQTGFASMKRELLLDGSIGDNISVTGSSLLFYWKL